MPTQTVIPSPAKLRLFAKTNTLSHPGIVTPSPAKVFLYSFPKPPLVLQCVNFVAQSATVPNAPELRPIASITVEARVQLNLDVISGGFAQFICSFTDGNFGYQFYFFQADQNLYWQPYINGAFRLISFNTTAGGFNVKKVHTYAGTYDGRFARIFVDGIKKNTLDTGGNFSITYPTTVTNLGIGGELLSGAFSNFMNGKIDDLRIWSVERSSVDLVKYRLIDLPSTDSTLGLWLKFNEQTGTVLTDSSQYGHDGTLNSGTWTTEIYQPLKSSFQVHNAKAPHLAFTQFIKPTPATIHLSAHAPAKLNMVQHPVRSVINISAHAPAKQILTQHPARSVINVTAHAPTKLVFTQHPTNSTINITAHAPKAVSISKIYPTRTVVNLSAHAPAKQILTQHPAHSVINITAHALKSVTITKVYPAATTVHLSAHAPKSVGISRVYATNAAIHLLAQSPAKINRVQKPSASAIHIAVSPPTTRLTQHVSRAVIHLSIPPPKINQTVKPSRSVVVISVPTQHTVFHQTIKPNPAVIHLSARSVTINNIIVHFAFTVKIRRNLNFRVILPTK